jgi:hypothetical protein
LCDEEQSYEQPVMTTIWGSAPWSVFTGCHPGKMRDSMKTIDIRKLRKIMEQNNALDRLKYESQWISKWLEEARK